MYFSEIPYPTSQTVLSSELKLKRKAEFKENNEYVEKRRQLQKYGLIYIKASNAINKNINSTLDNQVILML